METKAERLAQARKKLRDYQSKHRIPNREDVSSPSPSVSSYAENGGRQSAASLQLCNHDEAKSAFRRVRTASQGSPSSTTQSPTNHKITNITNPNNDLGYKFQQQQQNGMAEFGMDVMENSLNSKQECIRLREELALRTAEKGQLSSQLTELIGHYSQIHAAYTKLSECMEKGDLGGSALQMQLVHLQTAMSVVVKEKTALQQQLRQKNELIADRNKQTHSLTVELKEKTSHITLLEAQVKSLRKEIDTLSNSMERQREESENGLKEAINWQAKVLRMQQDRDDAQERLKICMKEAEAAQAELDEARKQLRMKDIYLRQLGAYTGAITATENDAQNFSDQIERLKNELATVTSEAERWKKEAQLAREHYESYGTQLNQNIVQMSTKLEEVSNEKLLLEAKVQVLENQIEMLQMMGRRANSVIDDNSNASVSLAGLQEVQDKLTRTADDLQKAEQLSEELKMKLMIKEQELLSLSSALSNVKSELAEKNTKLADVEESLARARSLADEQQKHTEGALSLSEQLQNEKATVSRAIAQNHELKEQLIELQDKLVVVTQESMERESGRLSALHMVAQLRNELNRLNAQCFVGENVDSSTAVAAASPVMSNGDVYELQQQQMQDVDTRDQDETVSTPSVSEYCDRDVSLSHTENAHTHAELELINVKMALEELRLEHRRVVQENEELRRIMEQNSEDENQNNIHVELGQAVDRINTLSAENEQLRNDVSMLQEKLQSASLSNSLTSSPSHSGTLLPVQSNGNAVKQLQALPIAEKPLAWTELEARFTRAMQQIADLVEEKERLQHVVMQLETENDTIGDYVTLYQHQRKKINERMREREEAVAKLSFEKEQMQRKLTELQETLIHLLSKRGLLHVYEYEKGEQKGSSRPSKRAREVRSYSHSTADEFCGDEETIVDGTKLLVPDSPDSCIDLASECENGKYVAENKGRQHDLDDNADDDVGVQRILNLISELQDLERTRTLPPCSPNLHCSECRGKLINL